MSPSPSASCPHELRPGTTVCLHCRHAEHLAATARRRRLALRLGGAGLVAAIGVAGASRLSRAWHEDGLPAPRAIPAPVATADAAPAERRVDSAAMLAAAPATVAPAAPTAPPPAPASVPRSAPMIAEGRTELGGGIVAVRTGDTVAVHFDTRATRTRRRDKFERIVRATLPAVYGAVADSLLALVPEGQLARGDLLAELPVRGVHLHAPDGTTLALWPETRPGRDGPLVVTYRATLAR